MGGTEASAPAPTSLGGVDGYLPHPQPAATRRPTAARCGPRAGTGCRPRRVRSPCTVNTGATRGYQADTGSHPAVEGCDVLPGRYDQITAETQAVLDSLQFAYPGATAAAPADGGSWKTAVGGIAAVAAAATALAGALAGGAGSAGNAGRKDQDPADPTMPIGYVLQLSTSRIGVGAGPVEPLTVRTYAAFRDGTFRAAPQVPIQLAPPPGVQLSQTSGAGQVLTTIAPTGRPAAGAAIQIMATSELGATTARVAITDEAETRIVTRFEPNPPAEGLDTLTAQSTVLVAWVEPGPSDPQLTALQLAPGLSFQTSSRWLMLSTAGRAGRRGRRAGGRRAAGPVQPGRSAAGREGAHRGPDRPARGRHGRGDPARGPARAGRQTGSRRLRRRVRPERGRHGLDRQLRRPGLRVHDPVARGLEPPGRHLDRQGGPGPGPHDPDRVVLRGRRGRPVRDRDADRRGHHRAGGRATAALRRDRRGPRRAVRPHDERRPDHRRVLAAR